MATSVDNAKNPLDPKKNTGPPNQPKPVPDPLKNPNESVSKPSTPSQASTSNVNLLPGASPDVHQQFAMLQQQQQSMNTQPKLTTVTPARNPTQNPVSVITQELYINWDRNVYYHIRTADFIDLDHLLDVLRSARRVNFSVKSVRDSTRQMLADLVRFEINETQRAPEEPFVYATNSVISDMMDAIISALYYGERTLDHDERSTVSTKFSGVNSSSKAIARIFEIISKNVSKLHPYGVFSRSSFEVNYKLKWGTKKVPVV